MRLTSPKLIAIGEVKSGSHRSTVACHHWPCHGTHLSMPEVISRSLNFEKPVGVLGLGAALNRERAEPTSEPALQGN